MRSRGLLRRRALPALLASGVVAATSLQPSVQAAPPVVTLSAAGAKMKVTSASLSEAIDALSRAAGFKVTYEGPRPGAMLYNAEIDTPSVAQTLFRLIDGQNLNYAVMFDLTGKKVTSLLVLGVQPKTGGASSSPASGTRPQPFTPPRGSRSEPSVVEDEAAEPEPEATPQPTPATPPPPPARGGTGSQGTLAPPSPFAPRPPFGSPFGPRPSPTPSP